MTTPPIAETPKIVPTKPAEGEPCPHCGSPEPWGTASWCPDCGFYPALGGTSLRSAEEIGQEHSLRAAWETPHQGPTTLLEAIPPWAWMAMAGAFLILLANVAARVMLPLNASQRTLLTLIEFSLGFLAAGFAQGSAYLFAACRSDKYGPFDFFMKPIEIWKPTLAKMPEGSRRVHGMAWGMTAIFSALFVMGGFAFNDLFEDWGFEERGKGPNVLKEAVKKARNPQAGEENLEGAMKEFVGEDAAFVPLETRCVILGYTKSDRGELDSVVLASAPQGRLAYVGLLSQTDIPASSRAGLLRELQATPQLASCYLKQGVPLTKAIWIEPKVHCMIEHKSWTAQYRLQQPTFRSLVLPEEKK